MGFRVWLWAGEHCLSSAFVQQEATIVGKACRSGIVVSVSGLGCRCLGTESCEGIWVSSGPESSPRFAIIPVAHPQLSFQSPKHLYQCRLSGPCTKSVTFLVLLPVLHAIREIGQISCLMLLVPLTFRSQLYLQPAVLSPACHC